MYERQHAGVLDHTSGKRSYRADKRITADGDLTSHADGRNVVEEQKQGDDVSAYGATVTDWQVQRRDLDVGGTYRIPKKKMKLNTGWNDNRFY